MFVWPSSLHIIKLLYKEPTIETNNHLNNQNEHLEQIKLQIKITSKELSFTNRLNAQKSHPELEFDFLSQLKNVYVKNPLIKAIKDVPIYTKNVMELCLKNPGRKWNDPHIVHVLWKLVDIILGNLVVPKYADPSSSVVDVQINGTLIKKSMVNLGAIINVMTREIINNI